MMVKQISVFLENKPGKLKELTDIQTGYPFRGAIVAGSSTEGLAVIQMGDLVMSTMHPQ